MEIHYTPKHGSWLNMAEIELSVMTRQCINQRTPDRATLAAQVRAWVMTRNLRHCRVDWRFTTANAWVKLKRLSPSTEP